MIIEAGLTRYEAVNEEIEKQLKKQNKVTVKDVNGQRYIGCALDEGKTVEVYGTPGNDMACYLNGGRVVVYGNCQDAVGNTMGGGEIVVHGHSGDAMGYGMRDGQIYIRDNVACRGGIHMKEFRQMRPVLVIGKNAGSFLGEYMASSSFSASARTAHIRSTISAEPVCTAAKFLFAALFQRKISAIILRFKILMKLIKKNLICILKSIANSLMPIMTLLWQSLLKSLFRHHPAHMQIFIHLTK